MVGTTGANNRTKLLNLKEMIKMLIDRTRPPRIDMDKTVVRIKDLCEFENISREDLAKRTGITYSRWHNLMNSRGKIRSDEIEVTGKAWPEYMLWIAYGIERPKIGQYSPKTKATLEISIDSSTNQ